MEQTDTKQMILGAGRAMVQAHGYNALSFREIAKEVGIRSASIHYHFPTKGDLAAALARSYTDDAAGLFDSWLTQGLDQTECMRRYVAVFRNVLLNDNRMCLYGIMAAERDDLSPEVRVEVDRFAELNVRWLIEVLGLRRTKASLADTQRRALAIFAAIEGAQLVARGRGDVTIFDETVVAYRASGLFP